MASLPADRTPPPCLEDAGEVPAPAPAGRNSHIGDERGKINHHDCTATALLPPSFRDPDVAPALNGSGQVMSDVDLGIRSQKVKLCDHIAYFWETDEEFSEAVGFLEVGLRAGDFCVIFGHPEANERVLAILADRGFSQTAVQGQLAVLGGKRVPNEMLSAIANTFKAAVERGARLIRLLGNIGWSHPDWPSETEILQFEAQVTEACRKFPSVILCMYDVHSLSGQHPLTMCDSGIARNPYYVPAGQYLARYLKAS